MVNQDPQPEIYTQEFTYGPGATTPLAIIRTRAAANEEVRIYAIMVEFIDTEIDHDADLSIFVGSNRIPTNPFDIVVISERDDRMLKFPSPILVLYSQELALQLRDNRTAGNDNTVKISLIAEISIARVRCRQCGIDFPATQAAAPPCGHQAGTSPS